MYYIGIDVGGMSIKAGLCTAQGEILNKATVKTQVYNAEVKESADIVKVISDLLLKSNVDIAQIAAIGIGHPGSIDARAGIIRYSNNIALENVPIVAELKETFKLPIYINNDANCAALGEAKFGSGKGCSDSIFVTLGTGVGSGIIINNELFEGKDCAGAEAGHTVIIKDGLKCNCGRKGCWEVYASATALMRQTKEALEQNPQSAMAQIVSENGGEVDGKTAFIGANMGDATAISVRDTYIDYIGEGLLDLANIFRPEVIIIGGGVSHEGAVLTDPLNKKMETQTYGAKYNPKVRVTTAKLGNDAGILGAAALGMK